MSLVYISIYVLFRYDSAFLKYNHDVSFPFFSAAPIFDRIVRTYHRRPEGIHPMNPDNWFVSLSSSPKKGATKAEDGKIKDSQTASKSDEDDEAKRKQRRFGCALDLRSVGLKQPVRAVLVARRNVAHLPLPAGCHSPAERLAIELQCAGALAWLASQPNDSNISNPFAGGRTISLTPKQAWAEHAAAAASIVTTSATAAYAAAMATATDSNTRSSGASGAASFSVNSSAMALPSAMEAAFAAASSGLAPPGVASMGYLAFGTTMRGSAAARHAGFASSSSSSSAALAGTDPSTDPFVTNPAREAAGLCRDWPMGRGCFLSADRGASLSIKYGFQDHLEVAVVYEGYDVAAPFQEMHAVLTTLENALNGTSTTGSSAPASTSESAARGFAVHPQFGFLTSCPSHVGTALSAQLVGVPVPNLRQLYTDQHITDMTSSFGLLVGPTQATGTIGSSKNSSSSSSSVDAPGDGDAPPFGSSGRTKSTKMDKEEEETQDHDGKDSASSTTTTTTVGPSGWVDMAPSRTAFCREADLALKLYHGVRLLLLEDTRAGQAAAARLAQEEASRKAELEAEAADEKDEDLSATAADDEPDASSVLESAAALSSGAEIAHLSEAERKAVLGNFREMLENGVRVVKFNRKGKVAFPTLVLFGDHTLTWRADRQRGGMRVGKGYGSGTELFDLREMTHVQLGEALDHSSAALLESTLSGASLGAAAAETEEAISKASSSLSSPETNQAPAAPAAGGGGEASLVGTATLRMHAAGKDGATVTAMRSRGECASLCFDARTIDFGCDCSAQRDTLVRGFRLLLDSYTARSRS